ncbi:MAG: hypothetical protein AB1798_22010 [Spirochaetota bacterium]
MNNKKSFGRILMTPLFIFFMITARIAKIIMNLAEKPIEANKRYEFLFKEHQFKQIKVTIDDDGYLAYKFWNYKNVSDNENMAIRLNDKSEIAGLWDTGLDFTFLNLSDKAINEVRYTILEESPVHEGYLLTNYGNCFSVPALGTKSFKEDLHCCSNFTFLQVEVRYKDQSDFVWNNPYTYYFL